MHAILSFVFVNRRNSRDRESDSKDRVEYFWNLDDLPRGVPIIHYAYDKQLEWKIEKVKNDFRKIGKIDVDVKLIIGMPYPFRYRNHTQVQFQFIKI